MRRKWGPAFAAPHLWYMEVCFRIVFRRSVSLLCIREYADACWQTQIVVPILHAFKINTLNIGVRFYAFVYLLLSYTYCHMYISSGHNGIREV